jgi:hypothetical protein
VDLLSTCRVQFELRKRFAPHLPVPSLYVVLRVDSVRCCAMCRSFRCSRCRASCATRSPCASPAAAGTVVCVYDSCPSESCCVHTAFVGSHDGMHFQSRFHLLCFVSCCSVQRELDVALGTLLILILILILILVLVLVLVSRPVCCRRHAAVELRSMGNVQKVRIDRISCCRVLLLLPVHSV